MVDLSLYFFYQARPRLEFLPISFIGHYRVPDSGRVNPALQISDETNDETEANFENSQENSKITESGTWSTFKDIRLLYGIAFIAFVLSLVFVFVFSRDGMREALLQSLNFDSKHSKASYSRRDPIHFSTAVELKNGFVQV